jgi:hypothetical protein
MSWACYVKKVRRLPVVECSGLHTLPLFDGLVFLVKLIQQLGEHGVK